MNFARRPVAESGQTARLGFEDIRHGYGQGDVVKGVSLSAAPGEVLQPQNLARAFGIDVLGESRES